MILLALFLSQTAAAAVSVERIDESSYRLTLRADADISIDAGRARMLPTARATCEAATPVFGRYNLVVEAAANPPLRFEQELVCGAPSLAAAAAATPDPQWQPDIAHQRAALAATYSYFAARDSGRYADAHAAFSERLKQTSPFSEWRDRAAEFAAAAGAPRGRQVVELSWYNNPSDAPGPGLYVAADWSADFANLEFACGYLMWRLDPDGSFRLVREEQNFIDRRRRAIASLDRAPLRAQMGCKD